jgi:hypothetical protein
LLALIVDLLLVGVIFQLDANYLEMAAASSARINARIQRIRAGNVWHADGKGQKVRFSLPALPFLWGVGPILWRQLLTATRGMGRLLFLFLLFGSLILAPLLAAEREIGNRMPLLLVLGVMITWMTVMFTAVVPFDFRGDVDRMAVLKTLPLAPWAVTLGQVLAPTLVVSLMQWLLLAVILVITQWTGQAELPLSGLPTVLTCAAVVLPFNFQLFALENLLFLLFPTRLVANNPGDFQAVGRSVLFLFFKMLCVILFVVTAGAVGLVLYFVSQNLFLTGAGIWIVLVTEAAITVPLTAHAFGRFDVGRDTPP